LGWCSAGLLVTFAAASTVIIAVEPVQPTNPDATTTRSTWSLSADGFASVSALGQNGTTGGATGRNVNVETLAELEKYAKAKDPYVIRIKGTITKEPFGKEIAVSSNKTLIGLGADATILQGEFHLANVSNMIIRNLTIRDSWVPNDSGGKAFDYDTIQMDNVDHIWIDHCLLTHMEDRLIDLRKKSDCVTVLAHKKQSARCI
jgi:pectinesterase